MRPGNGISATSTAPFAESTTWRVRRSGPPNATLVSAPLPCTLRVSQSGYAPAMSDADNEEPLVAIVEIPKGSSNKYEWDEELGAIKLDRLLFASLGYPTD